MRKTFLTLALLLASLSALAQSFPAKPVEIVVSYPPGGTSDIIARTLQPKLSSLWSQPVVVDNKPGASSTIGAAFAAKSAPDGYTLLIGTPALAVSDAVFKHLPYDTERDLTPVGMLAVMPSVLVVNPTVPAKTPQELVRYVKANPGKLNFASAGATSAMRFAFEHLMQLTGMKAVHVPYKGAAPALQAVLSNESQMVMMPGIRALQYIKSGKLRAIATTTLERIPELPDVPTLAETVAPGFDYVVWQGLFVPAGTPASVVSKLNRDVNTVLREPEVRQRFAALGMEAREGTPEMLGTHLRDEIKKWKEVARIAHISVE